MNKFIFIFFGFISTVFGADTVFRTNDLILGPKNTGTRCYKAEQNLGSLNPYICYDSGTGKWIFTNDGVIVSELGSGGSGGGGNFDPSDLLDTLDRSEAGSFSTKLPGSMIDTFSSASSASLTNMGITSGSLQLTGSNLTGIYERTKELNITATSVQGGLRGRLQQVAPKNTAFSPSSSAASVTITFSGDVSNMFQATKGIIIVNKTTSDGSVFFKAVRNTTTTPKKVEVLTVSSVTYNSGPDETALVVSNPNTLDLDLNITSGNYNTDLRVIPFDVKIYAKGTGSYPSSDAALTDLISLNNIGIAGETLATLISGLTGSALKIQAVSSKSGQYIIGTIHEKTAGNNFIHRIYSTNSGNSWTDFGSVTTLSTLANEFGGSFNYIANKSLFVADNGKAVFLRDSVSGGQTVVLGEYSDLSVGSPALTALPNTGIDAANSVGGAGFVFSNGSAGMTGTVWGDPADGSGIFMVGVNTSTGAAYVRQYNAGGSVFLNVSSTIFSPTFHPNSPYWVAVSGSSGSHRYLVLGTEGSNQRPYYSYFDEGSGSIVGQGFAGAGVNSFMVGAKSLSDKLYGVYARPGTNDYAYVSMTTSGTPSISSEKVLTNFYNSQDQFNGWSGTSATFSNFWKHYDHAVTINPSDSNHAFFTLLPYDRDSARRARIWEVRSDSGFVGSAISQLTQNAGSFHGLRDNSARQQLAQTITLSSTRVRTFMVSSQQVGFVSTGNTVYCEIQATTGGLPNGTVVATSLNTYDPNLISLTASTAGQVLNFNFDTQTLTGVYAFVLKGTHAVSSSNYIGIHDATTNPYAGGELLAYDGSVWTAVSGYDIVFDVNSEWIYSPQNESIPNSRIANISTYDMEPSIELIDNTNIAYVVRNWSFKTSDSKLPYTGYLIRRVINIGSGSNASTVGANLYSGYSNGGYDPNLVLNVQSNNPLNAQRNTTTGVIDTTKEQEDRSSSSITTIYMTVPTYTTQGSMQNGKAASNFSVIYSELHNYMSLGLVNPVFAVEMEIITPASFASTSFLMTNANGGTTSGGFYISIDTSGRLSMQAAANSGFTQTLSSTTLSTSTYYKIKFVADGAAHRFYVNGTEVSYSSQVTAGYTMNSPNSGNGVVFGSYNNNTSLFAGHMGYYRVVVGKTTFTTSGYVDQSPFVSLIDLGSRTIAKKVVGINDTTNGVNFYEPVSLSSAASAMVDSYDVDLIYNNTVDFAQQGDSFMLKLNYGRASTRNISVFPGLNFRAVAP